MKQFKNKLTEINIPDLKKSTKSKIVNKQGTYVDLVLICVRTPKKGGFGVEEMRKRFRIIDAIEILGNTASVKLEDQDADLLKEICTEFKWNTMHKDIVEFTDYIENLKKVGK